MSQDVFKGKLHRTKGICKNLQLFFDEPVFNATVPTRTVKFAADRQPFKQKLWDIRYYIFNICCKLDISVVLGLLYV